MTIPIKQKLIKSNKCILTKKEQQRNVYNKRTDLINNELSNFPYCYRNTHAEFEIKDNFKNVKFKNSSTPTIILNSLYM